jgi:NitT/TauT family transport system ATP-binding protein
MITETSAITSPDSPVSGAVAMESTAGRFLAGGEAVNFDHVHLQFDGKPVLDDISFSVRPGQFVCLIGPSGCGKTTLLRLAAGLLAPTSGIVTVGRHDDLVPSLETAFVFQDYGRALLPWRDVYGNVSLALEAMNVPKAERPARIDSLLGKVGLATHRDKYPAQLSGGMQQRLHIARCLAQTPKLFLMDEPFGALDAMTRQSLKDELLGLIQQSRATVLFVTHDLEEALYLGSAIVSVRRTIRGYAVSRADRPSRRFSPPSGRAAHAGVEKCQLAHTQGEADAANHHRPFGPARE